jgi:hypothetical protein
MKTKHPVFTEGGEHWAFEQGRRFTPWVVKGEMEHSIVVQRAGDLKESGLR